MTGLDFYCLLRRYMEASISQTHLRRQDCSIHMLISNRVNKIMH